MLYFAHQQLFRTADRGRSWSAISPDLTREDAGVPPNLDPATAAWDGGTGPRRGVIYAIAPSRVADRDIWVGTDDGLIWRSRDEGAHWSDVTPQALGAWSKVTMLEVSHTEKDTAWAAVDRHRLDDFAPYIYRTVDGGRSWTLSVSGIPRGSFVNAVREDPVRPGLLYAGTEKGMVVSFDGGDSWQSLQLNLPVTSVRDIDVHGSDVVIATHGRALWILDDVTPLRQVDAALAREEVWLFAPQAAVRVRPAGFTGTPLPKDEPRAENPPFGANLDYVLSRAPAGAVTLSILDEKGDLVRRYSSTDKLPELSREERRLAPEWLKPPVVLPATPGMHRFVWPLRYPAPPALGKNNTFADGVWAPPGRYTAELSVDGQRVTRPLAVEPDPRVTLEPAAYGRQFELARRVERAREAAAAAMKEAEALHKQLVARAAALPARRPAGRRFASRRRTTTQSRRFPGESDGEPRRRSAGALRARGEGSGIRPLAPEEPFQPALSRGRACDAGFGRGRRRRRSDAGCPSRIRTARVHAHEGARLVGSPEDGKSRGAELEAASGWRAAHRPLMRSRFAERPEGEERGKDEPEDRERGGNGEGAYLNRPRVEKTKQMEKSHDGEDDSRNQAVDLFAHRHPPSRSLT